MFEDGRTGLLPNFCDSTDNRFHIDRTITLEGYGSSSKASTKFGDEHFSGSDAYSPSTQEGVETNPLFEEETNGSVNIYRYKISNEMMEMLYQFSKIHQYDARKDFKEAWNKWVEDNDDTISLEKRRLMNLGFDGDIIDKLFKSARYYFRKKSPEKKPPKERRNYIGIDKNLLLAMDEHIKKNKNVKPEYLFDEFCKENIEILKEEVSHLCGFGLINSKEIQNKIKKTFKNRYFILNKNK